MTEKTNEKKQRLLNLLREMFQLDQPDLDFGLYRIMHAKRGQVEAFLENEFDQLIDKVFAGRGARREEDARKEYEAARRQAIEYGAADPDNAPKVRQARARYDAVRLTGGEDAEIYGHLYRFFSRYYDTGDFMSLRRYGKGAAGGAETYAIPYDGSEVVLHWANKDQYYIKTTENFSAFSFDPRKALQKDERGVNRRLFDDADSGTPLKVHFRVVEAGEGAHNNVKAGDKDERYFLLDATPIEWQAPNVGLRGEAANPTYEGAELAIRLNYRSDPEKSGQKGKWQEKRNGETVERVLAALAAVAGENQALAVEYLDVLAREVPKGKDKKQPLLARYLARYTASNTMDYFIHKDLGGFLRRELDFYLKNEVLKLDDFVGGEDGDIKAGISEARLKALQTALEKTQAIRLLAQSLIDFLAQIEDFQKKLWLKKKFVVETNYCITLDRIPEKFYPEIAANERQREEWVKLFAIDELPDFPGFAPHPNHSPQRREGLLTSFADKPHSIAEGFSSPLSPEGRGAGGEGPKTRYASEWNPIIRGFAKEMRHAPTEAEARLWYFLRSRRLGGYKFRRQHPVAQYILDFVCVEAMLAVELDGSQHADLVQQEQDEIRRQFLNERGLRVLRFWNNEVLTRTEAVLERIWGALREFNPSPPAPLPSGERGDNATVFLPLDESGELWEAVGFLRANPSLVLDTRHFSDSFKQALLAEIDGLDEQSNGLLVHSDNFQALCLMQGKLREQVDCIYIDPPYNTGSDGFRYKDAYPHASWLAMIDNRLQLARRLASQNAALFVSLDDNEQAAFRQVADETWGRENFVATVIWQKIFSPKNTARHFSEDHDFILVYARDGIHWTPRLLPRTAEMEARYSNPDNDPRGPWTSGDLSARNPYSEGRYPITCPSGRVIPGPPPGTYWRVSKPKFEELDRDGRIWWGENGDNIPRLKRFLSEVKQGRVPQTIWSYQEVGHTQDAKKEMLACVNLGAEEVVFQTPKPTALLRRILALATNPDEPQWVLDFFAGSASTAHAVIQRNREDNGRRRYVLMEMEAYFDELMLPRVKKAVYAKEWSMGKPIPSPQPFSLKGEGLLPSKGERPLTPLSPEGRGAGGEGLFGGISHCFKYLRLESYEDCLNNLALNDSGAAVAALGDENLQRDYLLRYMLDVETQGSQSLLNVAEFRDPTAYRLEIKKPGSDERVRRNVDLVETFNWLIGLHVDKLHAGRRYSATFTRKPDPLLPDDAHTRLQVETLSEAADGPWWFRPVEGYVRTVPGDDRHRQSVLVLWRSLTDDPERDAAVLEAFLAQQLRFNPARREDKTLYDVIYINGTHNLPNLGKYGEVRLLEEEFHRRMWSREDV